MKIFKPIDGGDISNYNGETEKINVEVKLPSLVIGLVTLLFGGVVTLLCHKSYRKGVENAFDTEYQVLDKLKLLN